MFTDQMNLCLWAGNRTGPEQINNCSNASAFSKKFYDVLGRSLDEEGVNGFMKNCYDDNYPSTSCSEKCWRFLHEYDLVGESCLAEDVFRFYSSFTMSDIYTDVFKVQSQIQQCLYKMESPNEGYYSSIAMWKDAFNLVQQAYRYFRNM